MVFSQAQLKILAEAYCAAKGVTPNQLCGRILGESNRRAIERLQSDPPRGISANSAEAMSAWFIRNWPRESAWPEDIPRPRRRRPPTARRQAEECAQ